MERNMNCARCQDPSHMDRSQMERQRMDHSQMERQRMDHSQMERRRMDHSQMDCQRMDHSQMERQRMDHSQMQQSYQDQSCMNETCINMALGMAYVPWQQFNRTYEAAQALQAGTIFPELDKPFYGRRGMKR